MHKGKYVFAQLLDFIDKDVFLRLANKYDGNRYVKQFTYKVFYRNLRQMLMQRTTS